VEDHINRVDGIVQQYNNYDNYDNMTFRKETFRPFCVLLCQPQILTRLTLHFAMTSQCVQPFAIRLQPRLPSLLQRQHPHSHKHKVLTRGTHTTHLPNSVRHIHVSTPHSQCLYKGLFPPPNFLSFFILTLVCFPSLSILLYFLDDKSNDFNSPYLVGTS
jgi:hypothetical protein